MPKSGGIDGPGLASLAIGSIFAYAGIKGYSVLKSIQNMLQGQKPTVGQSNSYPLTNTESQSSGSASPLPSGSYSHDGLMKLWIQAGGSQSTANNAACHAVQESGGNPQAESANPDGGTNVGLWQLDTKGKGAGHSIESLKDPLTNARIAVQGSNNGRDWSAWATPGC